MAQVYPVGGGGENRGTSVPDVSLSCTEEAEKENMKKATEKFTVKEEQTTTELPISFGDGGSYSSSSHFMKTTSETVEEDEDPILQIKQEEVNAVSNGNELSPSTSTSETAPLTLLPRPMEGLHEMGPPPFLKKTFEMVEDPESNPIVSWSPTRNSFIVWDSYELSEHLLPKYFKHKNFASFIRQLNTYGFRKVDSERWEFANADFQGGKRHLLKNIKRRNRSSNKNQQSGIISTDSSAVIGLETEIDLLKKGQNSLRFEILRLKQQQDQSNNQMIAVEEQIRRAESRQQHLLFFLAKAAKDPKLVQRLLLKRKQIKELDLDGEIRKKQKLIGAEATGRSSENKKSSFGKWDASENSIFGLSMTDEFDDSFHEDNAVCEGTDNDISSVYGVISNNLMEESMNGTENGENMLHDSKIYMELEDLICKNDNMG